MISSSQHTQQIKTDWRKMFLHVHAIRFFIAENLSTGITFKTYIKASVIPILNMLPIWSFASFKSFLTIYHPHLSLLKSSYLRQTHFPHAPYTLMKLGIPKKHRSFPKPHYKRWLGPESTFQYTIIQTKLSSQCLPLSFLSEN